MFFISRISLLMTLPVQQPYLLPHQDHLLLLLKQLQPNPVNLENKH